MPLFDKENQTKRQEARQLRKKLRSGTKAENQALRIANRGTLFSQAGSIVSSLSGGALTGSNVTGTRELAIAQNEDGSTDIMTTLKNFAPVLLIGGVVVYFLMGKKKKRR